MLKAFADMDIARLSAEGVGGVFLTLTVELNLGKHIGLKLADRDPPPAGSDERYLRLSVLVNKLFAGSTGVRATDIGDFLRYVDGWPRPIQEFLSLPPKRQHAAVRCVRDHLAVAQAKIRQRAGKAEA